MNSDYVVKNATIVTCDAAHTILADAAMVVNGKSISWIGSTQNIPSHFGELETLDAKGNILMPGLINMHAHCGDSLFRGLVENLPLEEWLQTLWKAQAVILPPPENCFLGAQLGMAELLLGGTTCVMDNYWHADQTILAAKDIGMRVATGGIFFDPPGMDGKGPEGREKFAADLIETYAKDDDVFVGVMPHGTYTVAPENVKVAIDLAKKLNGFFSIHTAETRVEQETIKTRYDTSVVRLLHQLGGLSPHSVLAHCVHVDDEEMDLIAAAGAHVAHNPLSNLKLASGFAPIPQMLEKGINVTLGTDGAISGNDLDMWLSMRLAATIHKAANNDPAAITSHQALHMATLNGAKALGAQDILGSIETGKRADFILVDVTAPHAFPMFNPINHLVFSASKNDVTDVFVSGQQIVRNSKILTIDLAETLGKVKALQPQIIGALAS